MGLKIALISVSIKSLIGFTVQLAINMGGVVLTPLELNARRILQILFTVAMELQVQTMLSMLTVLVKTLLVELLELKCILC